MTRRSESGLAQALDLDAAAVAASEAIRGEQPVQPDIFAGEHALGQLTGRDNQPLPVRGVGRPAGSLNKTTRELRDYINRTGKNPVLWLADMVATPVDVLARTLKCKPLEAAEFARKCAVELARYTDQAMPTAVQVQGANAGMLVVNLGVPVDQGAGGLAGMALREGDQGPIIDVEPDEAADDAAETPSE
jgi:hypothetical protein